MGIVPPSRPISIPLRITVSTGEYDAWLRPTPVPPDADAQTASRQADRQAAVTEMRRGQKPSTNSGHGLASEPVGAEQTSANGRPSGRVWAVHSLQGDQERCHLTPVHQILIRYLTDHTRRRVSKRLALPVSTPPVSPAEA